MIFYRMIARYADTEKVTEEYFSDLFLNLNYVYKNKENKIHSIELVSVNMDTLKTNEYRYVKEFGSYIKK